MALLALVYLWAGGHYLLAARTLATDGEAVRSLGIEARQQGVGEGRVPGLGGPPAPA